MVNIKTYSFYIGLLFFLFTFFGCGAGGSTSTDSNAGAGSIGFGLAWESPDSSSMSKSTVYRAPSTDVCTDYGVTTINSYVINSSNSTVTSGSWACSEHGGSHTAVPAGSNYTLRVEAVVSGAVKWRGEVTGISIITGQTTNIGQITMSYIGNDTTLPTVSSTSPASNATSVPVNSTVTVTFSEKIAPSSLDTTTFTLSNGPNQINGTVSYDQNSMTATFAPISPLSYATTYTATLTTGVKDMAGNNLQSAYTWTFTTGSTPDTTPPTVSSTNPANSATNVAVNTAITATFSETMDASTVSATRFTLNNGVTGTVAYSGTTATFTPSSNLAYSTTYTATIMTGVKDLAGNPLASNYSWSFTTQSTSPPSGFTISGLVLDENSNPINNAVIALVANGVTYSATSDSTGSYYLHLDNSQASYLPPTFAVNAYEPTNHNPSSKGFLLSDGNIVVNNFVLLTISGNPQLVTIELAPEVHHIGNSSFSGSQNSQFQFPNAEGTTFSRNFSISAAQKVYTNANLTFIAKGVQCPDEVWLNTTKVGALQTSDSNGAFTPYTIPFNPSILIQGVNNTFQFKSVACSGGDIDDLEFSNVQINF